MYKGVSIYFKKKEKSLRPPISANNKFMTTGVSRQITEVIRDAPLDFFLRGVGSFIIKNIHHRHEDEKKSPLSPGRFCFSLKFSEKKSTPVKR